ncbi:MAG: cytochrome b [Psychrobium sp.]
MSTETVNGTKYFIDRILHWSAALLMLGMVSTMGAEIHSTDYTIKGAVLHKQDAISMHFAMGLGLLSLIVGRILWSAFVLEKEKKPQFKSPLHKVVVTIMHLLMYGALFSMIATGIIMINNYEHPLNLLGSLSFAENGGDLATFTDARTTHMWMLNAMYVFIVGHVGAAIYSKR